MGDLKWETEASIWQDDKTAKDPWQVTRAGIGAGTKTGTRAGIRVGIRAGTRVGIEWGDKREKNSGQIDERNSIGAQSFARCSFFLVVRLFFFFTTSFLEFVTT